MPHPCLSVEGTLSTWPESMSPTGVTRENKSVKWSTTFPSDEKYLL